MLYELIYVKPLSWEQVNFVRSCFSVKELTEVVGSNPIEPTWIFLVSIRDNCINCPDNFCLIFLAWWWWWLTLMIMIWHFGRNVLSKQYGRFYTVWFSYIRQATCKWDLWTNNFRRWGWFMASLSGRKFNCICSSSQASHNVLWLCNSRETVSRKTWSVAFKTEGYPSWTFVLKSKKWWNNHGSWRQPSYTQWGDGATATRS